MEIKENSISRTLKNPNITMGKLKKIAEFLEVDVSDLIEIKNASIAQEEKGEYKSLKNKEDALNKLSEIIQTQGRTIEMMAETEKTNSKNIENLVKLLSDK
jgi:transcriptional regulator with XRE-family HTH domain